VLLEQSGNIAISIGADWEYCNKHWSRLGYCNKYWFAIGKSNKYAIHFLMVSSSYFTARGSIITQSVDYYFLLPTYTYLLTSKHTKYT
jgi:hypothetical protein